MNQVRCAIYTRKSSEEGLEQDFNSLDAQREACAAYVLSQASEGWKLLPEYYDDGGLSGGTLERPALQRLLAEVEAGRVDIIVVYKVDRLTRSLLDFAKLVEALDAAEVSFVSVTQSFNTTTSMGRLTLNMLLSFAQFEREVTAERIRDKIAQSKAKGMWMGGTPPLGYEPDGKRSLSVVERHAALIRDIYARYRSLGNVRLVAEALEAEGIRSPTRTTLMGNSYGGCIFTRGQLYAILRNPVYAGDIKHKDIVYPGKHAPIIDRAAWESVQRQLSDNVRGFRTIRETNAALLAGLLFDHGGDPLIPVHTTKAKTRYRYYVSKSAHHGTGPAGASCLRLPAKNIERVACKELASFLDDPLQLIERCGLKVAPSMLEQVTGRCEVLSAQSKIGEGPIVKQLLGQVTVHPDRLVLTVNVQSLAALLGVHTDPDAPATVTHIAYVQLKRIGASIKLIHDNGAPAASSGADPTLTNLLNRARQWWGELAKGELDVASLSSRENVTASYMTRVVRLAFLAPQVVSAILDSKVRADLDGRAILATGVIAAHWDEQAAMLLPREKVA
jgi:site-specific DNA recombinase